MTHNLRNHKKNGLAGDFEEFFKAFEALPPEARIAIWDEVEAAERGGRPIDGAKIGQIVLKYQIREN